MVKSVFGVHLLDLTLAMDISVVVIVQLFFCFSL